MIIKKLALPRRTFLRGIGATIALPFLNAMVPALSAASKAARPVMRLGFVYVPNGVQLESFLPQGNGGALELTPILSPMEPFKGQVTVVTGLANAKAEALDEGAGLHTRSHTAWLSGARLKRTEGADIQNGTTLDQYAAGELGKETPFPSLELALEPNFTVGNCESGYSCTYINTFSWRNATTPLPMETNPRVVFDRLFGDGNRATRLADSRLDRSILDLVSGEMTRLQGALGPADRHTTDEYFQAIRDVERRLQMTEARADSLPTGEERPLGIPNTFHEHAELMFDLQFLGYQADLTRVVTFQMARELSTRSYPEIGVPDAHHEVSHHQDDPVKMAKNAKINAYHVQLFTHLLEKMHKTADGDGSLLDHSMLLYGAGMGDGNKHSPHNLPVVLVGGGCGQLKGDRHISCAFDTPMMNVGLSLLDKVGVELESIGDSTGRVSNL